MRILAVSGSLQKESSNLRLLQRVCALEPQARLFDGIVALPLFNPDLEPTAAVHAWRDAIAAADALFIATPEYGHSLPGALKNAIDWVIGSGELEGKAVAITASAVAPERGVRGLLALRTTLNAVNARIVGGAPIVRGEREDADLAALLATLAMPPPPADPRVRTATRRDLAALVEMRCALWPEGSAKEHEVEVLASLETHLVALDEDGVIVGFAEVGMRSVADGCDTTQPVGFLEGWFVYEDARRTGIGRRLIEAAESWARDHGAKEMASDTWIDTPVAIAAHLACGFAEVDRCVHFRKSI